MSSSLVDPFLSVCVGKKFESENGQRFYCVLLYFQHYHSSNEYRSHWCVNRFDFVLLVLLLSILVSSCSYKVHLEVVVIYSHFSLFLWRMSWATRNRSQWTRKQSLTTISLTLGFQYKMKNFVLMALPSKGRPTNKTTTHTHTWNMALTSGGQWKNLFRIFRAKKVVCVWNVLVTWMRRRSFGVCCYCLNEEKKIAYDDKIQRPFELDDLILMCVCFRFT